MRHKYWLAVGSAVLGACTTSTDPADGGFFGGVSAIADGTYSDQVAAQEAEVADAQARNAQLAAQQQSLAAQIDAAEAELVKLKFTLLQQRNSIGGLSVATKARIAIILNARPAGNTNAARLQALQKTIADARELSAELAALAV